MFNKLFGGTKRDVVAVSHRASNQTVDAIQKLAETGELLEKRKEVLTRKIAAELVKAKELLKKGNRGAAQLAMKRKALIEKQLEVIDNNIMRVQEQQVMMENSQATVQTVAAMQQAAKAHKATMAEFKIDKVDQVMDEIQETQEQASEIQQALAMPLGAAAEIDEDGIEAELAEMEAQMLDEELLKPAPTPAPTRVPGQALPEQAVPAPALPSVPAGKPRVKTTEDELAELEKELAA